MRRGTRTHRGSRMRPPPRRLEDVRRFFQSPVDAAPGTVVVNTAAIARRSAAGYHHRNRTSAFDVRLADNSPRYLVPSCPRDLVPRSICSAPDEREDTARWRKTGRRGGRGRGGGGGDAVNQFSATRFTCSFSET